MIRRRRRTREIPFSFDSFLDIVANVVGVIIRLILVVWVGARSYSSIQHLARPTAPEPAARAEMPIPADPLQQELARHRQELADAQQRLLAQLRQFQQIQQDETQARSALSALGTRQQQLEQQGMALGQETVQRQRAASVVALSASEIQARTRKLAEDIHALELAPPPTKTLRYRTPVSKPLQSEELLFECSRGRVTFIDIGAMLQEVRQAMEDNGKLLKNQWQVEAVTGTAGAFRLRYVVERERGMLDAIGSAPPEGAGSYRYGLSQWQIEPVDPARGETFAAALQAGSDFRQIADGIDSQLTAVTFWVYPDSFDLFRKLRDFLYERDIVVAGRPLPDGIPIASSRRGTMSRGQ
jgi:hypothetical protein